MKRWVTALGFIGVGWYIGICIIAGVAGGFWFDNKFDTAPVFVIVGLVLGILVAFYGVYRMLIPLMMNKNNKEDS